MQGRDDLKRIAEDPIRGLQIRKTYRDIGILLQNLQVSFPA